MLVVSNTTPLRYLVAIGHERLFADIFAKVHIPVAVFEELTNPGTPDAVRQYISSRPPWLEIHSLPESNLLSLPRPVHRGESHAITLAESLNADLLLIDERDGRIAAANRRFKLSGTLGLLEMANSLRLIPDFRQTIDALRANGFYLKPILLEDLLKRNTVK